MHNYLKKINDSSQTKVLIFLSSTVLLFFFMFTFDITSDIARITFIIAFIHSLYLAMLEQYSVIRNNIIYNDLWLCRIYGFDEVAKIRNRSGRSKLMKFLDYSLLYEYKAVKCIAKARWDDW